MNKIITPPLDPSSVEPVAVFDIEAMLRLYPYDHHRLDAGYKALDEKIRNFDPLTDDGITLPFGGRVVQSYGTYLADHLEWTSRTLGEFLRHQGYEDAIVSKVVQHFKRHDVGKILQPGQWKVTEGKQDVTEEQKRERSLHTILGADYIHKTFHQYLPDLTHNEIMGITVARHIAMMHHERLNGSGPNGLTGADMCPILRAATIVDTFHGKLKAGKTPDQIMDEMAGPKHEGEFDQTLLGKFRDFYAIAKPTAKRDAVLQP